MGKYELVRQLAVGGMAEVFLAKTGGALGFEKTVVVKRIRPHLMDDPLFLQMFLNEAKIAAQLNHPNVVQIFDFGEEDGAYFIAMEYIDGPNLRTLSTQSHAMGKPIPYSLVAKIVSYACEGLAFAHEYVNPDTQQPMNILHRDVSPDNIVLAKNGAVKVVDFGIAKAAEQLFQTQNGLKKGKLAYMSPEYLKGNEVDRRADVFALGVVLYELIANKKPYDAESEITLMHAMIYEPIVPVRARRAGVPEELESIVEKALARERDQRYPSCRELQADLERFVISAGEPLGQIHLSRLIASLPPEAESGTSAKTPNRAKSSPGAEPGRTAAGKRPSGLKTPLPKKTPGPSGEKRRVVVVTPAKGVSVPEESDASTVRMTAEELEADIAAEGAKLAANGGAPPVDSTARLKTDDLPPLRPSRKASTPPPPEQEEQTGEQAAAKAEEQTEERTAPERPAAKVEEPVKEQKRKPSGQKRKPSGEVRPPARAAPPAPRSTLDELVKMVRRNSRTAAIAAATFLLLLGGAIVVRAVSCSAAPKPAPVERPKAEAPVIDQTPQPTVQNTPVQGTEEQPPPPPSTPVVMGKLEVNPSVPGVVKVGGLRQRSAPYLFELKPGKYQLVLEHPATHYWIKRMSVEVKAKGVTEQDVVVAKGTATVAAPADVKVYVDGGAEAQLTGPGKIPLYEGKHTFKFVSPKKPKPVEMEAVVEPGKDVSVAPKFE